VPEPAIRVEALGKRYKLGVESRGHTLLSERLGRTLLAPFHLARRDRGVQPASHLAAAEREQESLWALRNVSLEIAAGEAVGLIGPNGAGKSTLLKLLSRITLPTEGRITLRGHVATLLEVGTGFHPELTGRENIFINGAILGMRRREIEAQFEEIVAFSGIERFIDTPVKRYSSGMYVRLAFAVAAHLQPEILLVDEVLAVGDAEFQRRCLGKMQDASEGGRTVVFVSHNLAAVQRLCSRAFVIDKGRLVTEGTAAEAVAAYLDRAGGGRQTGVAVIGDDADRFEGTGAARLRKVVMTDADGQPTSSVRLGQGFRVTLTFEVFEPIGDAIIELGISTIDGQRFATVQSSDRPGTRLQLVPGTFEIAVDIGVTLLPGEFVLEVAIHRADGATAELVYRVLRFTALNIPEADEESYPWSAVRGFVRPDARWSAAREVWPDAVGSGAGRVS
jgi:lipopolysaccharide transport system ATP-binding protein